MEALGYFEGDTCARGGCGGIIELEEAKNCSCHLSAPCSSHANADMCCHECGWRAAEDPLCVRDILCIGLGGELPIIETKRRMLDPKKIDWVAKFHSSSSMIKEGVYPEHLNHKDVEAVVRGTFGGRFESFGNGKFRYVAYTD